MSVVRYCPVCDYDLNAHLQVTLDGYLDLDGQVRVSLDGKTATARCAHCGTDLTPVVKIEEKDVEVKV